MTETIVLLVVAAIVSAYSSVCVAISATRNAVARRDFDTQWRAAYYMACGVPDEDLT